MNPKIGIEGALELLRGLEPQDRERILREILEREPALHAKLQAALPDFASLLKLEHGPLRELYFKTDPDLWTQALRKCAPEILDHVLAALPERARTELKDRILSIGPLKLSVVQSAQSRIAKLLPEG